MKLINIVEDIFREEDNSYDAELEQHIDVLFDSIIDNVSELQDIFNSDADYILKLVKERLNKPQAPKSDEELPF